MIRYRNIFVLLTRQIFVRAFVFDGRTGVGPGNDLVDVEGSMIAAIVVVWVNMDDLVPCLSQSACRSEHRKGIQRDEIRTQQGLKTGGRFQGGRRPSP